MKVIAIDPGTTQSAVVAIDSETLKPLEALIQPNEAIRRNLYEMPYVWNCVGVIEMVASYGMPVGKEVFETVVWIGRFYEAINMRFFRAAEFVYRREEKLHICGSPRANDANIRRALIDRFAEHDFRTGRGTKKNPDFFYGFKADMWAAYAVGLTYIETKMTKAQHTKGVAEEHEKRSRFFGRRT